MKRVIFPSPFLYPHHVCAMVDGMSEVDIHYLLFPKHNVIISNVEDCELCMVSVGANPDLYVCQYFSVHVFACRGVHFHSTSILCHNHHTIHLPQSV